ncbi:unnamed protein product [Closterium sp. NIES-65]|nr:unnamed protein product [Closterium sp. NIES-65]
MGSPDGIRWEMGRDVRTCRFHVPRFSLLLAAVFLLSLVALQQQTAFAQAVNGTDFHACLCSSPPSAPAGKTLLRIRNELNFTNPARSPKAYWKSAKSCDELFGVICDDLGYVVALSFLPPATLLSPHPIHPGRFPCSTLYGFNGSLPFPLFTSMSSPPPPCCPPIPFTPVVSPAARCMGSTALSPTPLANCPPSPSCQCPFASPFLQLQSLLCRFSPLVLIPHVSAPSHCPPSPSCQSPLASRSLELQFLLCRLAPFLFIPHMSRPLTALPRLPLLTFKHIGKGTHYSLHSYVLVLKRASVCPETFVSSLSFSLLLSLLPSPPLLPLPSFPPLSPSSHASNMAQNRLTGSLPVGISRLS